MAGVKVPTLNRTAPVQPTSVGQIEAKVPSTSEAIAARTKGIVNLGAEVVEQIEAIEVESGKTKAYQLGNALEHWGRTKLYGDSKSDTPGLVHLQGDPTDHYNKFDEEFKSKAEELMGTVGDFSPKVKDVIYAELAQRYNTVYNMRLTAYGQQDAKFDMEVREGKIALDKLTTSETVWTLDPTKPDSTVDVRIMLDKLENSRFETAVKYGGAKPNAAGRYSRMENGQVVHYEVAPSVLKEMVKDKSDALFDGGTMLVANGDIEKAEFLLSSFDKQIDPFNKAKLVEKIEKAKMEKQVAQFAYEASSMPYDQRNKVLSKINDPKILNEVKKQVDSQDRYRENQTKRLTNEAYETAFLIVQERMNSKKPFDSVAQIDMNRELRPLLDKMTGKQRASVYALVEDPKGESDFDAVAAAWEARRNSPSGMGFRDMPYTQFFQLLDGIKGKERRDFENLYRSDNAVDTESKIRSRVNDAEDKAVEYMEMGGYISKGSRGYSKKEQKKLHVFKTRVREKTRDLPNNMDPAKMDQILSESATYANDLVEAEQGTSNLRQFLTGLANMTPWGGTDEDVKKKSVKTNPDAGTYGYQSLSNAEKAKLKADYRAKHGTIKSVKDLMDFYNEQQKAK